jgi:predicted transcriptional regulator
MDIEGELIIKRYKKGELKTEIAEKNGLTVKDIDSLINEKILEFWMSGYTKRFIAKNINLTPKTVKKILVANNIMD